MRAGYTLPSCPCACSTSTQISSSWAACAVCFSWAVHVGRADWPSTWFVDPIGTLEWRLCVRRGHPLPSRVREADLEGYSFVTPIGWDMSGIYEGNDYCPIRRTRRSIRHQVGSAELAIRAIAHSDYLAFLPAIACSSGAHKRSIRTVTVRDWPTVSRPVYLAGKAELIPAKVEKRLAQTLAKALAA